jgi:nucleoside-diphosphate-sugar epimerase
LENVLITGGAGFVGSHLAAACIAAGYPTHVIVRPGSRQDRLVGLRDSITRHDVDLRSDEALRRCLRTAMPEIVFHLAAKPRRPQTADFTDAILGVDSEILTFVRLLRTLNELSHPPRLLVRAGSIAEYGTAPPPSHEDSREQPITAYGASLLAGTHYASALQDRVNFRIATARLALLYGPRQSVDYFIPGLIDRCLRGFPSIVQRPDDRRDLLFVEDAAAGLLRMAEVDLPPAAIVNLCTGIAPTMREVAALIVASTGCDPSLVELGEGYDTKGSPILLCSAERAQSLLGWHAGTDLADGIDKTVEHYGSALPPAAFRFRHRRRRKCVQEVP